MKVSDDSTFNFFRTTAIFILSFESCLNLIAAPPQIEGDSLIRFSIKAPHAKSIKLDGGFDNIKCININTNCIENLDSLSGDLGGDYQIEALVKRPDLYLYRYIIDGVPTLDPENCYTLRDVRTLYNVVYVPGVDSEYYKVGGTVGHGAISYPWYYSDTMKADRRISIYTPPGYESNSDRRYPVLYLLHGMGGDETAWPDLGRVPQILDNMISEGKVEPMIVVMPNGNIARQAAPGVSPLGYEVPDFYLPHTMDGVFESSFPEIVNYVDSHYRTLAEKRSRAIAGLSMGGFHSMTISATYPDKFDYIGLFSAATDASSFNKETLPEIYKNRRNKVRNLYNNGIKLYWIGIGKEDFLYDMNVQLRKDLAEDGLEYTYYESDGGHEWGNWRRYLVRFLPLLFR